jgi:hypothetical protein
VVWEDKDISRSRKQGENGYGQQAAGTQRWGVGGRQNDESWPIYLLPNIGLFVSGFKYKHRLFFSKPVYCLATRVVKVEAHLIA